MLAIAAVVAVAFVFYLVVPKLNAKLKTGRATLLQFPTDVVMAVPSLKMLASQMTRATK